MSLKKTGINFSELMAQSFFYLFILLMFHFLIRGGMNKNNHLQQENQNFMK